MKKAPIKAKNESNSPLFIRIIPHAWASVKILSRRIFAIFFNAEWCFLQLFNTCHESYAKVSSSKFDFYQSLSMNKIEIFDKNQKSTRLIVMARDKIPKISKIEC